MTRQQDYEYIDDNDSLERFCDALGKASCCAIDTEFVRESTYYPVLALIQIASDEMLGCIDPLAITDFTPLDGLLVRQSLLKVCHSSSQDLEILYQKFGKLPSPVFDTQLAAAVLGFNHQISYADLVQQVTGVTLEKKHTRANWTRRPLSQDELDYAMDDVRYLLPVYLHLNEQLESSHRRGWIERDLQAMGNTDNYEVDESVLWKRLKGVQKLKGEKLQIASDLCRCHCSPRCLGSSRAARRHTEPRRFGGR